MKKEPTELKPGKQQPAQSAAAVQRLVRLRCRIWWQWHCRRSGGLFLGLRYAFPCRLRWDDGTNWDQVSFCCGLLVATLHLDLRVPMEPNDGRDERQPTGE